MIGKSISKLLAAILIISAGISHSDCNKASKEQGRSAKPDELTILFSSDLLGKIRSCGCTIEDMGGLGRRAAYTERTRKSVRNLVALDAGDIMTPELAFTRKEAELAFDALNVFKLDALMVGEADFVFGLPFLQMLASRLSMPIVAANLVDSQKGNPLFGNAYTVLTLVGGLRIGITGVIDENIRFPAYIDVSGFRVLPAEETLKSLLPELSRKADFLILLSHTGIERSKELASRFGQFDIIVVGHGRPITKNLEKVGSTIILATGAEGQYIGRVDLSLSVDGKIIEGNMKLVPLEQSMEIHPSIAELFAQYGLELTEKEQKKAR